MKKKIILALFLALSFPSLWAAGTGKFTGYLFAYFEGSGQNQEALRFAVSQDAVTWHALNGNQPIIASDSISESGGIRDPHILRGEHGEFLMVATDMHTLDPKQKWGANPGIVMLRSRDLVHWTHARVNLSKAFPKHFADAHWVWAPQTIYDRKARKYMVYFTLTRDSAPEMVTYYAYANATFTGFESEPKVLFRAKYTCLDNDIIEGPDGTYHMFYKGNIKNAEGKELQNGIQQATAKKLKGPWTEDYKFLDAYATKRTGVEGSSTFKLNGQQKWVLMYDLFGSGRYEYQTTTDLVHFSPKPQSFTKDFFPRHGSVISLTDDELVRVQQQWGFVFGNPSDLSAYVMVYHKDQDHGLHMAVSDDGYTWTALNGDKPVVAGDTIAMQHGIRDPHIFRGPDGAFYVAMTDLHIYAQRDGYRSTEWERDGKKYGWGNNRGLVLMKSKDLIHWTRANIDFSTLPAQDGMDWREVGCVWAPETVFDEETRQLMIHFTVRQGTGVNRLYYAYVNFDFDKLASQPRLLAEAPEGKYSIIDGDIIKVKDTYHLFYVSHEGTATVKHASAQRITGPYRPDDLYQDGERRGHEAPNCWQRLGTDRYVVMFDNYRIQPMNFGFVETRDFFTYHPIGYFDQEGSPMRRTNFSEQKHGAVTYITKAEKQALMDYWK